MDLWEPSPLALTAEPEPSTRKRRASGIALWRPDILLADAVNPEGWRPRVQIAEPGLRPEAVKAQIEATRSMLASLAEARQVLGSWAAASEARALQAGSERERVAAMIETYRLKTELDSVLQGTLRQVAALMDERGPR